MTFFFYCFGLVTVLYSVSSVSDRRVQVGAGHAKRELPVQADYQAALMRLHTYATDTGSALLIQADSSELIVELHRYGGKLLKGMGRRQQT